MLDRTAPPPFVRSTSFELVTPLRKTAPNGIEVFFIGGSRQDIVKVEAVFHAGRWYEQFAGASHFGTTLLTKGARDKTSFQIAQIFDQYGAHIEIHPGLDFVSVAVFSLVKYLEPVLALLTEILAAPTFPQNELDQAKTIFIQNLRVSEEKTSYLASKSFRKNLFGENHPYGRELEESDVHALTREHLTQNFEALMNRTVVFASGKLGSQTQALVERFVASLKPAPSKKTDHQVHGEEAFHVRQPKERSVQTSIRAGKRSLSRKDPDYAAAVFVTHILGGYFGSRLMKNIREEKGLTYGIYASLHPLQRDSYFVIGADVNRENTDLTLQEIRKEINALRTEPMPQDELETARNHFIGSLQSEITNPFAHADKIKTIHLSGLPDDYYQTLLTTIDQMTTERVLEITDRHLHEDTLNEVCIG